MRKINRKKIEIICFAIITGVMMFSIKTSNKIVENKKTQQTTATPISGKVVILDAGHGGEDRTELFLIMELQKQI